MYVHHKGVIILNYIGKIYYCFFVTFLDASTAFLHLFCVSDGVKQGGITSRVLFNVYMDDLSCALNVPVLEVKLLII